jgi:hypothetical protein
VPRNTFKYAYHKRGKRRAITKPRVAPADKRMRRNTNNTLGGDLLATALHREEKERKIAEGRARRGLEPRFVYNFPRTPLECLYSLENALGESKLVRPSSSSPSSRSSVGAARVSSEPRD